jgi:hypothetical protein
MRISAEKEVLVLRFNNYKKWNFIEEHRKILDEFGDVWILKGGRPITSKRIQEVMDGGEGILILKEPKNDGGKYYMSSIIEVKTGKPHVDMKYPSYYDQMVDDYDCFAVESLTGTWIHIRKLINMNDADISHFHLISNGKELESVLASTRSSMLFVVSDSDLTIKE